MNKTYLVTAFPYAVQYARIEIPADVKEEDLKEYIIEHWMELVFSEPELDYAGTDFDIDLED